MNIYIVYSVLSYTTDISNNPGKPYLGHLSDIIDVPGRATTVSSVSLF